MKNTRRIIAAALALMLTVTNLTACGSSSDSGDSSGKKASSGKASAGESADEDLAEESYDIAPTDVVNDIDSAYRNAIETFDATRYMDDSYLIIPGINVDTYYWNRNTDQSASLRESFVYDQKIYYLDCPTSYPSSYEKGRYLSCANLDGTFVKTYFISENKDLDLKMEWVDGDGNIMLLMHDGVNDKNLVFYIDASSDKAVQLDLELEDYIGPRIAGFYDGKICLVSGGTIQLADTESFTFTDYVTDTDISGDSLIMGKYIVDSDTIYDLDSKKAVVQLDRGDEEDSEEESEYEKYFGSNDGGMYEKLFEGIYCCEKDYYYDWTDDHSQLIRYVRNKDYFVRDDKSDGEVVYTAADGEIDGWRLMNDDHVYIYDDGEGYLYNVNTDEKITIKSGCKWFEDVFGIDL